LEKEQQRMLEKYFKEEYTSGMKWELVNEKSVTV
jgi:3-methyladenine DNA glycosylase Tag